MNPTKPKSSKDQIKETGMCRVKYPDPLRKAVQSTISEWREFYALPLLAKQKVTLSNSTGYEFQNIDGPHKDLKEDMQITAVQLPRLRSEISLISENKRGTALMDAADTLLHEASYLIEAFAEEMENAFGLTGLVAEVRASRYLWIVRCIHYFGNSQRQTGEEIGSSHVDKSGFTLHLFESDEGLQFMAQSDGVWTPAPVMEDDTVIFPAMQLQYFSKGKIEALWHRVVATPTTAEHGRHSMVLFVPFANTPKWNKEDPIHGGRLQEKAPGYNYGLDFETFAKGFKH
jgi:isopenicillin N synthase-like dioxygenase